MRQIILDTETTGLDPKSGHRIVEIGAVELINRKIGKNVHFYINPRRLMGRGAQTVHGLTDEFLADQPYFEDVIENVMNFLGNDQLLIHNAPFDLGFLNYELDLLEDNVWGKIEDQCAILDTLVMARSRHPGQRNSLDALCKRYHVDASHRDLHGALLDANLLANLYLAMTGGQKSLFSSKEENTVLSSNEQSEAKIKTIDVSEFNLPIIEATADELAAHEEYMKLVATND